MTHWVSVRSLLIQPVLFHIKSFLKDCDDTSECLYVLCVFNLCCFTVNPFTKDCDDTWVSVRSLLFQSVLFHCKSFTNDCDDTWVSVHSPLFQSVLFHSCHLWSGLSEIILSKSSDTRSLMAECQKYQEVPIARTKASQTLHVCELWSCDLLSKFNCH